MPPKRKRLFVLSITLVICAIGYAFLIRRPTRNFTARLNCKELQTPFPLRIVIHQGTHQLSLSGYSGVIENVDANSFKPPPKVRPSQRRSDLHVKTIAGTDGQLLISPPDSTTGISTELEIIVPPNSSLMIQILGSGESTHLVQITTKAFRREVSSINWQVDTSIELQKSGLDIPELSAINPEQKVSMSPFPNSFLQFKLEANSSGASSLTSLSWRPKSISVYPTKTIAESNVLLTNCSGQVAFEDVPPVALSDQSELHFQNSSIDGFKLNISYLENPQISVALQGTTPIINVNRVNINPSRLEQIFSTGFAKQGALGLLVLAVVYVIKKVFDKATDAYSKELDSE